MKKKRLGKGQRNKKRKAVKNQKLFHVAQAELNVHQLYIIHMVVRKAKTMEQLQKRMITNTAAKQVMKTTTFGLTVQKQQDIIQITLLQKLIKQIWVTFLPAPNNNRHLFRSVH